MRNAMAVVMVVMMAVIGVTGCAPRDHVGPQNVFRSASECDVAALEYRVAPPDKLEIRSPGIREFDGLNPTIRPDGKISAGMLGEVYVAGKTPEEINKILTDRATKYFNNADIKVAVVEYASKFYFVYGLPSSVGSGGKKPFTGRDTVISALADALLGEDAWPENVSLARPGKKGAPNSVTIIDFINMMATGDTRQNYLIEEGDMIHIPDRPLRRFGKEVQNLVPISNTPNMVPTPRPK